MKEDIIDKLIKEISENHAKIIDNFIKTYIAGRWKDYFSKRNKIDFRRIELIEQRKSPIETIYFCRLKRGKLKV